MMCSGWTLEIAAATDRGRVRVQNEDSLAANPDLGYAVLADGMGGYNAGEVASRIAVATVENEMRKLATQQPLDPGAGERLLAEQVSCANAAIYRAAQREHAYRGMGTTLVMALWSGDRVIVAHVGDSRLYRWRSGVLEQVTRDHSLVQDQIDRGLVTREQARHAPRRHLVTRALGIDTEVDTEVHTYDVRSDDVYLLCSDGLTDMLDESDIAAHLRDAGHQLAATADALVQRANDRGGRDNISVILAQPRKRASASGDASLAGSRG